MTGESPGGWRRRAGLALAPVAGATAGAVYVGGWHFPPAEAFHWFAIAVIPVCLVVAIVPHLRILVALGLAPLLLHQPYLTYTWKGVERFAWPAGLGVGALLIWWLWHRQARRYEGPSQIFISAGLVACAGLACALSDYSTLGTAGMIAGITMLAAWPCCLRNSAGKIFSPVVDAAFPLLVSILLLGHYLAGLTATNALLIGFAPLAGWVRALPPVQRLSPRKAAVVQTLAVILPVAVALALAGKRFQEDWNSSGGDGEDW